VRRRPAAARGASGRREVAAERPEASGRHAESKGTAPPGGEPKPRASLCSRFATGDRPAAPRRGRRSCPITHPNGSKPPGPTFGAEYHGNGSIWVGLWHSNVVVWNAEPDGSVTTKFGWWRGVPGTLGIEGRRLDARGPPLTAHVPDGYGDSGFQSSGITFPTEGCWQVTGRVGDASLTFVTLILAA
jgi:hypothetical protein